jgi:hypothetical protein
VVAPHSHSVGRFVFSILNLAQDTSALLVFVDIVVEVEILRVLVSSRLNLVILEVRVVSRIHP